ncbi:MAG: transporter [Rhodospirillales bacterium]|jgi:ABC-type uncharacterized transport system involved in gliding motility auxiliary subunit|nr:transporter [Rhodospirillales bacterium]
MSTTIATPARRRLAYSTLGVIAALVLAVGVNILADRLLPRARIDLTEQRLYTLASGTRSILAGLSEPITLRLYYARRLGATVPVYGAYAERVRAMLEEYASLSNGRIRLEFHDPEPFSETEDRALAYGLQGVPIDQSGEQVYFGLAGTNLLDDERTIPFFQPERERFLEYDLTRLVYELSNPRRPTIGVMTSLPLNGDPRMAMMRQMQGMPPGQGGQPFAIMTQLRQFFTLRDIPVDARHIDEDVQILLLAHPQNLSTLTQYAVDQFVMRGGKLILLLDPHSEGQAGRPSAGGAPPASTASSLDRLINAWGVDAPADRVVLDLRGAWRVRAGQNDRIQAVDYTAWFNLQGDSINKAEVATAELNQVTVASAGGLRRREGSTIEFIPLLSSSERAMMIDAASIRREPNPAALLAGFRPDGERHVIAARIRGTLPSAFGATAPEDPERPAGTPPHRATSDGPANMVIIHDTDLLEDRFWVRMQDFFGQQVMTPISDNGAFVANVADTLAGGDALVSLRSRGESLRPFAMVDDLRREAETRFRQTERTLQTRLEETERRLRELRQGQAGAERGASAVITTEQRAEIDRARADIVATRRELRGVQLELRRDIESLESMLRAMNIALVPLLLTFFAIALGVLRSRRRAAARA